MKKCSKCQEASYAIFVFSAMKQLCHECWVQEKTETKKLIRKLPLITDKEAPLGWNRVGLDYYVDQSRGKTQANILYKYNCFGMVN